MGVVSDNKVVRQLDAITQKINCFSINSKTSDWLMAIKCLAIYSIILLIFIRNDISIKNVIFNACHIGRD
jgi:hypothetical protein